MTNENDARIDDSEVENRWSKNDPPEDGVQKAGKKRALMVGGAIAAALIIAAGTVVAVAVNDTDADGSMGVPLVAVPALDASENAADEIPTRKLAGIDVSGCTPAQITVGEDGWVGFDTSCVSLVASEDMPDQP